MQINALIGVVVALLGLAFFAVVNAQQAGTEPPKFEVVSQALTDEFGVDISSQYNPDDVDITDGQVLTQDHAISIGTPESGMQYSLSYSSGGQGWSPENKIRGTMRRGSSADGLDSYKVVTYLAKQRRLHKF
jgi:hypothetical protein